MRVVMQSDALTAKEIGRVVLRAAMFKRRGLQEEEAASLAYGLTFRDRDRDDRRVCIECAAWQSPQRGNPAGCFELQKLRQAEQDARELGEKPAPRHALSPIQPIPTLLQRCAGFSFAKP